MTDAFAPTLAAALARIAAVQPAAYAGTRNALDGAVSGLWPCITHGVVTLTDVLAGVAARHALDVQHTFVPELGWRAFFRQVWAPALFPAVDRRCDSFSAWWPRASRGLHSAAELRAGAPSSSLPEHTTP